ncbi:Protein mrp-like protein [Chlamydiales bacterium STE3]|nr:Protein mrp-like protein [Chlamydiales bacterium STE3]
MPLKMYQEKKTQKIKNVIGVAAGKGGVGKSSITVNLALALKKKGFNVGVLDADIYGPSLKKMLPPDLLPRNDEGKLIPALSLGIKVISIAYFRNNGEAAAVRAPIANGLIQQFVNGVEWGNLDFLLIDFPPGTGDIQLTLAQKANLTAALIVTTPQEIALIDVRKAMHLFEQVKVPCLGVVENMSYLWDKRNNEKVFLFGKDGGKLLANERGVPFLGEVPLDPLIGYCLDRGESIFLNSDAEESQQVFLKLADQVDSHLRSMNKQEGALSSFELIWKEDFLK